MQTEDFASTALLRMISGELRSRGVDAPEFQQFEGKTNRSYKKELLSSALEKLGPAAILAIGKGVHRLPITPMAPVLLAADGALDLLLRWQRMERYFHGRHRVAIMAHSEYSIELEHRSLAWGEISIGEHLFVAGLLAELLQIVGCKGLSLSLGETEVELIREGAIVNTLSLHDHWEESASTHQWTFSWSSLILNTTYTEHSVRVNGSITDKVSSLLSSDLSKAWRVAAVAQTLGMSTRSLQRSLARVGTNFQHCLRSLRADKAAKLLKERSNTPAAVGYVCGYSDQAHFSREFKLRFNVSPSEYAALSNGS